MPHALPQVISAVETKTFLKALNADMANCSVLGNDIPAARLMIWSRYSAASALRSCRMVSDPSLAIAPMMTAISPAMTEWI